MKRLISAFGVIATMLVMSCAANPTAPSPVKEETRTARADAQVLKSDTLQTQGVADY